MEKSSKLMLVVTMVMAYMPMCAEAQNNNITYLDITVPLSNNPAAPLLVNISKAGCGSTKLCASEPFNCDPAGSTPCFFVSAKQTSGQVFSFQLEGQTMANGFIALGLLSPLSFSGAAYVCASNHTNNVTLFSLVLQIGYLTQNNQPTAVMGSVHGNTTQCTFNATVPNANTTSFYIYIVTGTNNNGKLNISNIVFNSTAAVNLSKSNTTENNSFVTACPANNTTTTPATKMTNKPASPATTNTNKPASPATTNTNKTASPATTNTNKPASPATTIHAKGMQQMLSKGLLILLGVLGFMML